MKPKKNIPYENPKWPNKKQYENVIRNLNTYPNLVFPNEIEALLRYNGFEILDFRGGFLGQQVDITSTNLEIDFISESTIFKNSDFFLYCKLKI